MSVNDREDESDKFVSHKLNYQIIPATHEKDFYQQRKFSHVNNGDVEYNKKPERPTEMQGIYNQIIATCAICILSTGCGMPIGFSAVLLPQLSSNNLLTNSTSEILIDIEMGSWIASVHSLATPIGSFLSGPIADSIGRRAALLVSVIPLCAGWIVLASSQSYYMLLVGRLLCGFATGILGGPAQVYIAETTIPTLRNCLIGAPFVFYSLGILIIYSLGSVIHWRGVAWCGNVLPLLSALAIFFVPETPVWLLRHNKVNKALKALTFLRGNEIAAQKELNEMQERLGKEMATTKTNENIFELCCQRVAIKPLVIIIVFSFLQIGSGTFIVIFYAIDILSSFGLEFDTKAAAIWTAVVRMLCTLMFCVILMFVRRRRISIWSGIGSGLSCLILSVFMYAREGQTKGGTDVLVAGVCLLCYITFNTGLMVMPGIMIGELFPARIRGRTAGAVFSAMNVALFSFTKTFPLLHLTIKMKGVFLLFSVCSFVISLFMWLFQPEAKGRTLDQIEDYFNESNWLWYKRDKSYKIVSTKEAAASKA